MLSFISSPSVYPGMIEDTMYKKRLEELRTRLSEGSTPFAKDDYQGHMNFDITTAHYNALQLALPYNQNSVATESSPVASEMERHFIRMVSEDVGYDSDESWGYVSVGGTTSNIQGLWIARNKARQQGKKPKYVLASEDVHYSIVKGCDLLGLKVKPLKIDPEVSPKKIAAVVCTLGTTEAGRIDDIGFWVRYCREHSIHCHVDAAYGGYFVYAKTSEYLSAQAKAAFEWLPLSDSIAIDPHKMGYAPYPSGVFLLKKSSDTAFVDIVHSIPYLNGPTTSVYTIEGSRSGAFSVSADFGHEMMREHYPKLMESILQGTFELKRVISTSRSFELYGGELDLGIVLFKIRNTDVPMSYFAEQFTCLSNARNGKLQLVTTEIEDITYFRICVMDPTFFEKVDGFVSKLENEYEMYLSQYDTFVSERVKKILSISEECDTEEELEALIRSGRKLVAYNGFEPSGRIHIAQAVVTVMNANVLIQNGCKVILYIADWFAQLNHKMGGDLEKIKIVGRYFIEVFKACGIDLRHTEIVWASDFITKHEGYWPRVLDIATNTTLKRATRCCQIMGRKEGDALSASQIIYPCMQVADIFELGVDIPQLGVDQRKCNMLAREYAPKKKLTPPTSVAHHMLMGLKGLSQGKMSKSIPDAAVFMEDSEDEVNRKIRAAFCNDEVEGNPIFEYIRYIILRWFGEITICEKSYRTHEELSVDFASLDKRTVKSVVAAKINEILAPVRRHFAKPEMRQLADLVASFQVTR
jgi:tyrosyl-tRNA synthetase